MKPMDYRIVRTGLRRLRFAGALLLGSGLLTAATAVVEPTTRVFLAVTLLFYFGFQWRKE